MTDLNTTEVQGRTLTAFFDTRNAAQKGIDDLVAAGIPRQQIRLTEGAETTAATVNEATPTEQKGFWEELKDMFLPDEDRHGYAEGLRRGGFLLSVKTDEAHYTRVLDILDTDGAVDMDEREETWRSAGWHGFDRSAGGADAADSNVSAIGTRAADTPSRTARSGETLTSGTSARAASSRPAAGAPETLQANRDEVIPLYEETARVAKRDTSHGRVRLRTYVVEAPVTEQVNLRNEQVHIERRPVDRPVAAADVAFKDTVIEAEEHVEEAVLSKEARVKEEVALRKTVENQNQTVSGTVRRTEVEVDDTRGGHALSVAGDTSITSRITEHMPVIASDGTQIGTVDHMDGPDKIKLTKNNAPDGQHHYVPVTWIDHVDTHVHLNKTKRAVEAEW